MGDVRAPASSGEGNLVLAAFLMAVAAVFGAIDAVIVRLLANEIHPFVIGFFRSLFGLLFVFPWILSRRSALQSSYRFMHLLRAALKLLALVCFFAAFGAAPLADVTAIIFTGPIFVALGAWLVLGERLGTARILAVVIGFIGALIVIGPASPQGLAMPMLLALAGSALTATVQLMLKKMSARDSTDTLVAWNLILIAPLSLLPAVFFWSMPDFDSLVLLVAQGMLGALAMFLVTRALSMADASFLAPLDYVRLPAVAALAFLLFGEVAGPATWLGASIIFVAALLATGSSRFAGLRARLWNS